MNSYYIKHDFPIFRNNYNLNLPSFILEGVIKISYCKNNKDWLVFKNGEEIGILNKLGVSILKEIL